MIQTLLLLLILAQVSGNEALAGAATRFVFAFVVTVAVAGVALLAVVASWACAS